MKNNGIGLLKQAHDSAEFLAKDLSAAMDGVSALEAFALNRVLIQASELRAEIAALLSAVKSDMEQDQ